MKQEPKIDEGALVAWVAGIQRESREERAAVFLAIKMQGTDLIGEPTP